MHLKFIFPQHFLMVPLIAALLFSSPLFFPAPGVVNAVRSEPSSSCFTGPCTAGLECMRGLIAGGGRKSTRGRERVGGREDAETLPASSLTQTEAGLDTNQSGDSPLIEKKNSELSYSDLSIPDEGLPSLDHLQVSPILRYPSSPGGSSVFSDEDDEQFPILSGSEVRASCPGVRSLGLGFLNSWNACCRRRASSESGSLSSTPVSRSHGRPPCLPSTRSRSSSASLPRVRLSLPRVSNEARSQGPLSRGVLRRWTPEYVRARAAQRDPDQDLVSSSSFSSCPPSPSEESRGCCSFFGSIPQMESLKSKMLKEAQKRRPAGMTSLEGALSELERSVSGLSYEHGIEECSSFHTGKDSFDSEVEELEESVADQASGISLPDTPVQEDEGSLAGVEVEPSTVADAEEVMEGVEIVESVPPVHEDIYPEGVFSGFVQGNILGISLTSWAAGVAVKRSPTGEFAPQVSVLTGVLPRWYIPGWLSKRLYVQIDSLSFRLVSTDSEEGGFDVQVDPENEVLRNLASQFGITVEEVLENVRLRFFPAGQVMRIHGKDASGDMSMGLNSEIPENTKATITSFAQARNVFVEA